MSDYYPFMMMQPPPRRRKRRRNSPAEPTDWREAAQQAEDWMAYIKAKIDEAEKSKKDKSKNEKKPKTFTFLEVFGLLTFFAPVVGFGWIIMLSFLQTTLVDVVKKLVLQ